MKSIVQPGMSAQQIAEAAALNPKGCLGSRAFVCAGHPGMKLTFDGIPDIS